MAGADDTDSVPYWTASIESLVKRLDSSAAGLTSSDAFARLQTFGPNRINASSEASAARLLLRQLSNPLVLILVAGALVSLLLNDQLDAAIILIIVTSSALLGFWQEFRASSALAALRKRLTLTCRVLRDGKEVTLTVDQIVPGDVVALAAGNLIPADGRILEATDFLVNEASLTGESFPVEKRPGTAQANDPLGTRANCAFMGSSVRSGTARLLVAKTGMNTAFGQVARRLRTPDEDTHFARGVRKFGVLLLRVMFVIVLFVLAVNQLLGRPLVDSMLFAIALAVGLSPELLPAIISVTLSRGARHLASGGVIVRRLDAIESFGSIDVLCTDKTGTLTEGVVNLEAATDYRGDPSVESLRLALINASLESGIENPLDAAIVGHCRTHGIALSDVRKVDEIPYDFQRRRLTIVFDDPDGSRWLVTKGAFAEVLETCERLPVGDEERPLAAGERLLLERYYREQGLKGYRVLALAARQLERKNDYDRRDEEGLTFLGFLLFVDPPKPTAADAITALRRAGIGIRIISGDNRHVCRHLAQAVGLDADKMLTGSEIAGMRAEASWHRAPQTDLFAEIDPQQKELIVHALQRAGHVVGYLGDGINDAPALCAADIGISVDKAVDVARESADIVLLRPDLGILLRGIEDGRRIFANTLKYISITISANFGNMVSMAVATPILPFLPLLPKQILLNNFLSDLPAVAIAGDAVDQEALDRPQKWDLDSIRRFMMVFGLASSTFDLLTFAALLSIFHSSEETFQTTWFVVSLLTELVAILVLRTRLPAWRSRPSQPLLFSCVAVAIVAFILPWAGPLASFAGLVPLGFNQVVLILAVTTTYAAATEALKHWLERREAVRLPIPRGEVRLR